MKIDYSLIGHTSRAAHLDAKKAEDWGFDGVWSTESVTDAFLQSMAVSLTTDRVKIGTAIAVAFSRNPMSTAYCAWDLANASNGRFTLGMGTQVKAHIEKRFSMPWSNPAARMEEYIGAIQAIFHSWRTGDRLRFEGQFYSHTLMTPVFTPPRHDLKIPIAIAAVGEVMTALAARLCDGVILHGMTSTKYLDIVTLPAIERGLVESGRHRSDFEVSVPLFLAIGDTDKEMSEQRNESRRLISFYGSTPAYKSVLDSIGYGEIQPQLNALSKLGDWDKMMTLVSDDLLDQLVITGKPEEIANLVWMRFGNRFDRVSSYFGWPTNDVERMNEIVKSFHSLGKDEK